MQNLNCEQSKKVLLQRKNTKTDDDFAFELAFNSLNALEPGQLTDEIDDALAHLYGCADCLDWHRTMFPEYHAHLARVAKYCCANMFYAVNNSDETTRFTYGWIRDDPCWLINDDWAFANFCPWCGTALPDGDFEPTQALEDRYIADGKLKNE